MHLSKVEEPSKSQAPVPRRRLRKQSSRIDEANQTPNAAPNGTLPPPRHGADNLVPKDKQATSGRRTRTSKLSPLQPAQSMATNVKSRPQGEPQTNSKGKRVSFKHPLSEATKPLRRQRPQAGPSLSIEVRVPRRSAWIAELQKARGSEQDPKASMVPKRKRNALALSIDHDSEQSRPKRRNIPTPANRPQIRGGQGSADTRARPRLRPRSS